MESGYTLAWVALPVLVWVAASIDALRRPADEFEACGLTKRSCTGVLLLSMLAALGPLAGLAYFLVAFPKLRRQRRR
jgi:hypothetical protein